MLSVIILVIKKIITAITKILLSITLRPMFNHDLLSLFVIYTQLLLYSDKSQIILENWVRN